MYLHYVYKPCNVNNYKYVFLILVHILYVTDNFYEVLRLMFCCVLRSLTIFITDCTILRMATS